MNKTGFTLIEIVIALFISSVVAVSAYQILNRTQKTVRALSSAIENDLPIPVFYSQLERDLLGIVVPPLVRTKEESTKTEISSVIETLEKALEKRTGKPVTETKSEIEEIQIKDLFLAEAGQNKFFMSFITTGGIKFIPTGAQFKVEPLIKRVAYSLEPDKTNENQFKVVFKQSQNLNLDAIKKQATSYDIIDNIKSIKPTYWVYELSKEKEDSEKATKPKLVKLDSWNMEEVRKKYKTQVPAFIEFEITFFNSTNPQLDYKLNFSYSIPVYFAQPESKTKVEQEDIKQVPGQSKPVDSNVNNKVNKNINNLGNNSEAKPNANNKQQKK